MTSSLEKAQAGKEKKEQELLAAHQALEETNKKLQVSPRLTHFASPHLAPLSRPHPSVCIYIPQYLSNFVTGCKRQSITSQQLLHISHGSFHTWKMAAIALSRAYDPPLSM